MHLGERRVTRLPAYRQWISSCGPSATHLLVGESQGTGVPTLKGFTTLQARLNALDPVLHPLMHLGDAAGGVFGGKLGSWDKGEGKRRDAAEGNWVLSRTLCPCPMPHLPACPPAAVAAC